ncbi:hypothetical protein CCACVL1_21608, partial [Corchorus capsularis]
MDVHVWKGCRAGMVLRLPPLRSFYAYQ